VKTRGKSSRVLVVTSVSGKPCGLQCQICRSKRKAARFNLRRVGSKNLMVTSGPDK